jgi:hypothetical protein
MSLSEFMNQEFTEPKWLVENLISSGGVSVISGQPGVYKSWLLLDLALKIANGEKFLGYFATTKQKVLMIDEENQARDIYDRIKKLNGDLQSDIEIISRKDFMAINSNQIVEICKSMGIGVVMIDSLIRIHKEDENSATGMSKVSRELKKFNDISVIITHHNCKPQFSNYGKSREVMRGSSDILASLESQFSVRKVSNGRIEITQCKARTFTEHKPLVVDFIDDGGNIEFKLSRIVEHKIPVSKLELARGKVVSLIEDCGQIERQELIAKLKTEEIGESSIRTAIDELKAENIIIAKKSGTGSSISYSLKTKS